MVPAGIRPAILADTRIEIEYSARHPACQHEPGRIEVVARRTSIFEKPHIE